MMASSVIHLPLPLLPFLLIILFSLQRSFSLNIGIGGGGDHDGTGIGIGIGGGGGGSSCSESCPPRELGPSDFQNIGLYQAYLVIQRFKKTITCDPKGITNTWVGPDICKKPAYTGFYCETPPKLTNYPSVAAVDFNGYYLEAPTVSGFIDKLPTVALFHANSNRFHGDVPGGIASLQYFYELDVSNNLLSGSTFPYQVLGFTNVTFLDIRFNSYAGTLPPGAFCSFPRIQALFVNNNLFTGPLPDNFGSTPANYISLANNRFAGPISRSIGNLTNTLFEVLFLNNTLSGCLPYEIGLLKRATVFDAGLNKLTGPIPESFACLEKIEQLNFAYNELYGCVPDALCHLGLSGSGGHLTNLSLSNNYFTAIGPSCHALIERHVLDIRKNCIPGLPDQRSPEDCKQFFQRKTYCPANTYVPCKAPYGGLSSIDNGAATSREQAAVADGSKDRSRDSSYRTYNSLDVNKKP